HPMCAIVARRRADQIETLRSVEHPEEKEMGEAVDVGQAALEFRQQFHHAVRVMLCAQSLRDRFRVGVRRFDVADGSRGEHDDVSLHFPSRERHDCRQGPRRPQSQTVFWAAYSGKNWFTTWIRSSISNGFTTQ